MLHQADIRLVQYTIGRLRADALQIRGEGGPLAPALVIPIELDLHEADGQKLGLARLHAELWTRPDAGPRLRVGLPTTIESAGRGDTRPLYSLPRGGTHHFDIRIDLLGRGVRLLDDAAQSSSEGPIMLVLHFEAELGLLEDSPTENLPSLGNPNPMIQYVGELLPPS